MKERPDNYVTLEEARYWLVNQLLNDCDVVCFEGRYLYSTDGIARIAAKIRDLVNGGAK